MKHGYILKRFQKKNIYLTPFLDETAAADWMGEDSLTWYASGRITNEERRDADIAAFTDIDRGVDRWIQDMRYFPRLLIVATVFLVVYFLLVFAIRDPIPMLDEFLVASVASVVTSYYLIKRDKQSAVAMKRRMETKQMVSQAEVEELPGLDPYEAFLDEAAQLDYLDITDRLARSSDEPLPPLVIAEENQGGWQQEVKALLLITVKKQKRAFKRMYAQLIEARKGTQPNEALAAKMVYLAMANKLDLSLLALCVVVAEAN